MSEQRNLTTVGNSGSGQEFFQSAALEPVTVAEIELLSAELRHKTLREIPPVVVALDEYERLAVKRGLNVEVFIFSVSEVYEKV